MFSPQQSERRHSARKRIAANVYVSWQGQARRYRTCDISTNGVLVATDRRGPPLGALVELVFVLPRERVIQTHRLSAVVARVSPGGSAMTWYRQGMRPGRRQVR
jgi:hypothetical protein